MDFFAEIYSYMFEWLFGQNIGEHLSGWDVSTGDYTKTNLFNVVGFIAIGSSLLLCVIYYYVINHPRFNRWWSWLIVLGVVGIVNLFIGFSFPYSDLVRGDISPDIIDYISIADCWMFGIANLIISIGFFIIFSFSLKWWSSNCKHSPFL